MKLITKFECYALATVLFLLVPEVIGNKRQSKMMALPMVSQQKLVQPFMLSNEQSASKKTISSPSEQHMLSSNIEISTAKADESSYTPETFIFEQQIKPYEKSFPNFVSKIKTAQTVTSYLPEWATDAINWGLEKCGSQYKLDTQEMDFLNRFFSNKRKYKHCIASPDHVVDQTDLKVIFENFAKTSGEFKEFKKVLKRFTISAIPNVEDRAQRHTISDKTYFRVVTTNFLATHLYDQGFRLTV